MTVSKQSVARTKKIVVISLFLLAFAVLGDYRDAAAKVKECTYRKADATFAQADYATTEALFSTILDYQDAAQRRNASKAEQMPVLKPGDHVTFGRRESDDDLSNGPDPIEWQVLDVQGEQALLLTRQLLNLWEDWDSTDKVAQQMYDAADYGRTAITWEHSVERYLLNTYLLSSCFSDNDAFLLRLTSSGGLGIPMPLEIASAPCICR